MRGGRTAVALALVIGLLARAAAPVSAHGGTVRVNDVYGPYHLVVVTGPAPQAGELLITVVATIPQPDGNETPLVGATLTATFALTGPTGTAPVAYPLPAEPTLYADGYYEHIVTVPGNGTWQVTIDVAGASGPASAGFIVNLRRPPPGADWLMWGVAVLPIVVGLGLFVYLVRGMRLTHEDDLVAEPDDEDDSDSLTEPPPRASGPTR